MLRNYRRIHHVKFLAFHGNQLEYNPWECNGSQGANGAGSAGRIQTQGHEIHYNFQDTVINFKGNMFRKESLTYKQNF